MKRISRTKRRFLIAVVRSEVCTACRCAPGFRWRTRPVECVDCHLKWLDVNGKAVDTWL